MGLSKKTRRKRELEKIAQLRYYVPAAGIETTKDRPVAPTLYPDVLGMNGRKLDEFGVDDRRECVEKNVGIVGCSPAVLWSLAKVRLPKKN